MQNIFLEKILYLQRLLNSTYCNFFHRFSRFFDNFLEFIQTMMQKKSLTPKPFRFLIGFVTFWAKVIKMWNLAKVCVFGLCLWKYCLSEISVIPAPPGTRLSSNNLKKMVFFHVLGSPSAKICLFRPKISVRRLWTLFSQKTYF